MSYIDTQYRLLVVGDRPFCYWDPDISRQTVAFLESLDPTYFESLANILLPHIEESLPDDEPLLLRRVLNYIRSISPVRANNIEGNPHHAALALRMIHSQALETFFALLCSAIQAPRCAHVWMIKYQPKELRQLLQKLRDRQTFPWQLRESTHSWAAVSDFIHASLVIEDKQKERKVKRGFGSFWARLASDFLRQPFTDEYNNIKHGLRIRSGGFSVAIGREDQPGVRAPKDRMQLIGRSDYGSSFFVLDQIGDYGNHFQSKRSSQNWSPTDIAWALHLVSMSIANVVSALRILNGTPAEEARFQWPSDLATFSEPWKRSAKLGVTSMTGFGTQIHPSLIEPFSREDILSRYSSGNDGGAIRRLVDEGN